MSTSAFSPPRTRSSNASVGANSASIRVAVNASYWSPKRCTAPLSAKVESTRTVSAIGGSGPAHQFEHRRQAKAALAGERGCFQQRSVLPAAAGKSDPDLMAAEHGIIAFDGRMFLVEDLPLPAAFLGGVAAEVIERCIAAENATVIEQHDAGQAALDTIEHTQVNGIEPVDDAALTHAAGDWDWLLLNRGQHGLE